MSLVSGTRLGPYEILGLIGAGGMGEVYQARDTRLERTVAIKVLLPQYSTDPERRARFEREARTVASLNHPHICTLHDVGEHRHVDTQQLSLYLVMEYVIGETLAARLQKGPLPLRKALTATIEIAEALAAAHRQGIVHRDLKPSNVVLTTTGAKLLDFGVAKLKGVDERPEDADSTSAPTGTLPLTGVGMIVGTLNYMAPEQLQGKATDARADLWALGAMLYEMVTGRQAFAGDNQASVVAAVLEREPPSLSTLDPLAPTTLDLLIRRCLAKTPDHRWDSAHGLAEAVRWIRDASAAGQTTPVTPSPAVRPARRPLALVLAATVLSAAATSWVWSRLRPPPAPGPVVRTRLDVVPAEIVDAGGIASVWIPTPGGSRTALAWTPDGRSLVFVGRRGVQQLYVRALEKADAVPMAGTEGAQVPAVSPDGQWVAFWAAASIKKVPVAGGPVMDLVPDMEHPPTGLAWDAAGGLFFGKSNGAIWHVPAGGVATAVTTLGEAERAHIPSAVLPGGRVVLYAARKRDATFGDEDVVAWQLATGERKVLLHDGVDARYVPTGHLVFLRRGVLFAVPFDAGRLEVRGEPVAILEGVAQALAGSHPGNITGAGQYAFAGNGTLAWIAGAVAPARDAALVTVDRSGRVTMLHAPVRSYVPMLRVSPDGRQIALTIQTLTEVGLWSYDVGRGLLMPLHRSGEASWPIWSPDGRRLAFRWLTEGRFVLASLAADGSAPPEAIAAIGDFQQSSYAPDGSLLGVAGDHVAMAKPGSTPGRIDPLRTTAAIEHWPEISPDGRWLAYGSSASGRMEVYVQPYPGRGTGTLVSVEGGVSPAWHPGGGELFYVTPMTTDGKRRMMAVDFEPGPPARIAQPRVLFEFDPHELAGFSCIPVRCYDVARDGQRFYAMQVAASPRHPAVTDVQLIENWFEELKVAARK
jgi:serine/threonine-protein kinase